VTSARSIANTPRGPASPVRVRDVEWSDFDELRDIYYHLYEERDRGDAIGIHLFDERPSLADEVEWFASMYRRAAAGDLIVSVAERDGKAVGHCTISRIGLRSTAENGHLGLLGILVSEDYRGQGIGSALLTHALDRARDKFEIVRLSVFADNARAQELYRRFGFAPCGRVPDAIRRNGRYIDEVEMYLDLRPPGKRRARN
jgi:L-phenylalanine/L-methionine N-acetyltransferase